ncbi:hypothetical protein MMUR_36960 [Mycolicibacterium murale]|uniref:Uncharacterized protein n=1 Tax=Mycolicibacterium murale TaxID=182220 RepID=A0A7I9WQB1_9MYCO|nr:hypothetical protein MMUR_36960 [Mycolicibacterium murale]
MNPCGLIRNVNERESVPQAPSDTGAVVLARNPVQDPAAEAQDAEPSSRQPGCVPGAHTVVTRP